MTEFDPQADAAACYEVAIAAKRAQYLMEQCPAAKRVEVIGAVTMYLADCREVLPTLPISDLCLTDPPYGIDYGKAGGFSASHGWGSWRENVAWDAERPSKELFELILARSKSQVIWGGNYFTDYLPPSMQWLVWDKGQRNFSLADCEFAWTSQNKAARIFEYSRGKALQDGKQHPTQKPVELMSWCLDLFKPKPKSVVDPFMGSGTSAISCFRRGIPFVGIERDEGYFDGAVERLRKAAREPDMFTATDIPQPEQLSILDEAS